MKKRFQENKNTIFVCTFVVLLVALVYNWKGVSDIVLTILSLLNPLFVAIAVAFVLNLPMSMIEKQLGKVIKKDTLLDKAKRTIAILLTLLFFALFLYLLLIIITPKVVDSVTNIFSNFGEIIDGIVNSTNSILKDFNIDLKVQDFEFVKDLQKFSWEGVFNSSLGVIGNFANGVWSSAMAFSNAFVQAFLGFSLSIYLLYGKEKYIQQLRKFVLSVFGIKTSRKIYTFGTKANFIFTKFIGGQLVDCVIKGVMLYIVFILLKIPNPELLAVIITVCSIVPVFGPMFAMMIDFVLIFATDPLMAVIFIVIFQVLTNLEGQILYPKIVGKSIGLPGIWVMLSIFILGAVFGLVGMVLAIPMTALAYDIMGTAVNQRLKKLKVKVVGNQIIEEETNEEGKDITVA